MNTVFLIILISSIFIFLMFVFLYNGLIRKKNQIENSLGSIDAMLKKRFDLIPNLVESCKAFISHENEIFLKLAELRTEALQINDLSKKNNADNVLSKSINGLFAIAENYPELKSSNNFLQLQASWNETEEQIAASRRFYNSAVTDYNNAVEMFPSNLVSKLMGLRPKNVFSLPENEKANISAKNLFAN